MLCLAVGIIVATMFLGTTQLFAHQIDNVVYVTIEIKGKELRFINLLSTQAESHLFYAGYPEHRDEIKAHIQILNNNVQCPLSNFLTHTETTLAKDPYFFVATCKRKIENLVIQDSYPLHEDTTLIYTIRYNNDAVIYTTSSPATMSMKIEKDTILKIDTEDDMPRIAQKQSASFWDMFFMYLKLGIEHILSGIDHIFFIIGFILLSSNVFALIKGITGFTVSHSITLVLSILSLVTLPTRIVEILIAGTIVIVGLLAFIHITRYWLTHFIIIFIFGLFHGLGFAGSISEVGFPETSFIATLIGFNVGIEIGQLLIVCAIYPLLRFTEHRSPTLYRVSTKICAASIVVGGIIWTIQRIVL